LHRIDDIQEPDFVCPHLPQEVFKNLNRELLSWATTISKTERRESGVVAYGDRLAIDNAVDRTKPTIVQHDAPTVSDIERRFLKRTSDKADLLAGTLVDLVACTYRVVAIRVELLVIFPMYLIEVCDRVGLSRYAGLPCLDVPISPILERLPLFGAITRSNSMTKRSRGVNGVPSFSSKLLSIVFLNQALVAGSPELMLSFSMML
jgi:hypothetical protein